MGEGEGERETKTEEGERERKHKRQNERAHALSDLLVTEIQKGNTFAPDLSVPRLAQLRTLVGGTMRFLAFFQ